MLTKLEQQLLNVLKRVKKIHGQKFSIKTAYLVEEIIALAECEKE